MVYDPHPLDLLLRKLETHSPLSDQDREAILALPFKLRTLEPLSYLVREGEPPARCAVLVDGFAFRQKLTGDGARQIVSVHMPGDALDFQHLFLNVADHSVQTLTPAEVAFVSRPALQALVRSNRAVCHAILVVILVEGSAFREWVLNVGRRPTKERLAHLLCEFAVRLESQGLAERYGYELPMTQEQLADALGVTPVHLNRSIRLLEEEGLIDRDKRTIRFPDWGRMREAADFTTRYLHLEMRGDGPP